MNFNLQLQVSNLEFVAFFFFFKLENDSYRRYLQAEGLVLMVFSEGSRGLFPTLPTSSFVAGAKLLFIWS